MNAVKYLITILLIVGGLNWGLVGLFNVDLVATVFGSMSALSRIVYALVGISAIVYLISWKSIQSQATTTKR